MKKIFTLAFLVISLITQGQQDRIKEKQASFSAPTEIGKPDGELTSQKIGKDGGTLISSDNKIKLTIPEGALSSETMISIQPTTNLAKGSVGKAYDLEPSGIQFQKPVQIVFQYTDKDMYGQNPKLMSVAWQNDKGVWKGLSKISLDTILKTITADITHFSAWVLGWAIVLEPEKTRIKVSKEMVVFFTQREVQDAPGGESSEKIFSTGFMYQINWFVNGIPGGNDIVGKIVSPGGGNSLSRVYQAPAKVPDGNPVEIKLEITDIKKRGDQKITIIVNPNNTVTWTETYWKVYPNTSSKCIVQVYDDEYEVKMESRMISGTKDSWGGIRTAWDKGSFIVTLDKKEPEVLNIQNSLEHSTDGCTNFTLLNPTTCTGLLHVAGTKQIKVTPANPPGQPYPIVEIWFVPFPVEFSVFKFYCPTPKGNDGIYGTSPVMRIGRAFPYDIKFLAKDGEQIIIDNSKESEDGGYLKVWVREINDD
jgi:hypothetical protein